MPKATKTKESPDTKLVLKYIDYWATEIVNLLLLFIAIFALFSLNPELPSVGDTRLFAQALILVGFVFLSINWYKRKQFEKELM